MVCPTLFASVAAYLYLLCLKHADAIGYGISITTCIYPCFDQSGCSLKLFRRSFCCTKMFMFQTEPANRFESRYSSVDIVTVYWLDGRGSNPGKGRIFLFSTTSRPALGSPSLLFSGYRGLGDRDM
jgi:hypothetical protein